ncbi:MAG: TauD/TfdA family dioxygenase [Magnetococcales bacterium]|nr:TauD/TfdA family dioxygenase [Magnetococcales bacterium]
MFDNPPQSSPFNLENDGAYQRWRQEKLADYPATLADLLVEIDNPSALSEAERSALINQCAKTNMVLYRVKPPQTIGDNPLPSLLEQLGVRAVDYNLGAGTDGLSKLSPGGSAHNPFANYIPYRQAAIGWHTDGYYNTADRQVRTLALYCERAAHQGGENRLFDHEMAYIRLRDQNPEFIRILMDPEVMTIPARLENGLVARPDRTGPVFSLDPNSGHLHMRYTARTISIRWKSSPLLQQTLATLSHIMEEPQLGIFQGCLPAGFGLISHNVLHTREAFSDLEGGEKRTLYRLRCFDRIAV